MALLNYTTTIDEHKTVAEIQRILVVHGANSVRVDYQDGLVAALFFKVPTPQGELAFRLPARPEVTLNVLHTQWIQGKIPRRYVDKAQAVRVSWRIIKDWVEAQMAILETEQVRMEQIFLPYLLVGDKTLYQSLVDSRFQLTQGKEQ